MHHFLLLAAAQKDDSFYLWVVFAVAGAVLVVGVVATVLVFYFVSLSETKAKEMLAAYQALPKGPLDPQRYLEGVMKRFKKAGYLCRQNVDPALRIGELLHEQRSLVERGFTGNFGAPDNFNGWKVALYAQNQNSSWMQMPEYHFLFTLVDTLDYPGWDILVGNSFCLAQLYRLNRERSVSLQFGVVAVVRACDHAVVQEAKSANLTEQFGDLAGQPFTIIVESDTGTVHFFERTPFLFGATPHTAMKSRICEFLLPEAGDFAGGGSS